ncbi:DinB family protein [Streptosporangium sp. NPDC020145]|uniref:DinB family protein n=1 Tax=Streptosporangium sp. NPDC020145 TaxID=3154694 RepID=UPI0034450A0F
MPPTTPLMTPSLTADEKTTLHAFLRYLRESVIAKSAGVDDEQAARELLPSGKSLLALLKHLTVMELGWVSWAYAGVDLPSELCDQEVRPGETAEEVIAAYRAAAARSDAVIDGCASLDAPGVRTLRPTAPATPTMRWVLAHLIEDTARHTGHADVLREQIDGLAGNWKGNTRW